MVGIGAAAGLAASALSSIVGTKNTATSYDNNFITTFEQQARDSTKNMVKALDKSGDGTLNTDEIGLSKDAFSSIDTNGDSKLSETELNAAYVKREMEKSTQDLMKALDTDGDGKLTANEMNLLDDEFKTIDKASAGAVGFQELMAAHPLNSLLSKFSDLAQTYTATASTADSAKKVDLTA
ncbi:MAG: EF-hand domain-containing protein [Nitrospirae bacterium]|nr:EF-hand domain-containing protein [Nitrospirota bacterium]